MADRQTLETIPVTCLKGVGPKAAERLQKLGIHSVQDVLFHLPVRYQDRTRVVPIAALRAGQHVVIEGIIESSEIRYGRRRSLMVQLADDSGSIYLRFFHFSAAQKNALARGAHIRCFAEARRGQKSLEMIHPEYQLLDETQPLPVEQNLTPVYPTTEGMHQLTWRALTEESLRLLEHNDQLTELIPQSLRQQHDMSDLKTALQNLHRPPVGSDVFALEAGDDPARQRLVFEEMLAHQISLRSLRNQHRQHHAPCMQADGPLTTAFLNNLPFSLTGAQQRTVEEIYQDLQRSHPMMRLVQGDVGSGKTVVAALAALRAIAAGYQVAMMAPTELLAEQHRNNFAAWLEPLGIHAGWLTGRLKGKARKTLLQALAGGELQIIIGTHALFQADVHYHKLGLVIIDEQHRFGVHQRLALKEKGDQLVPHQLVMTATPIPRTLAMTAFADLDISVIDELPPGRKPVSTVVIADNRRDQVIQRVQESCLQGRQAYWVCTLIEESEALQCQAAEDTAADLRERLTGLRIGLVHGRLPALEKETVMQQFKAGELDLLIATTVIEVGVDVPNASLMIIENPERLGLSQLHQLRGRVGRGSQESHCLLLYHPPLSRNGQERLSVMRETNDGFVIAQKDLELRGPGEVLGTRQTGEMQLRIADLLRDQGWLPKVQQAAEMMLEQHPQLSQALIKRWLGEKVNYANV